jgi:hypothetical protein
LQKEQCKVLIGLSERWWSVGNNKTSTKSSYRDFVVQSGKSV